MVDSTAVLKETKKQPYESGPKLALQREATVFVLLEDEKDHLSAEEIYFLVKQKSSEIGLAAVYRTLKTLTDLKAVDKANFSDGLARYDSGKEDAKYSHYHLLCLECGTIGEVEEDLLSEVEQIVEGRYYFLVKDHRLTFHGTCQSCQSKH